MAFFTKLSQLCSRIESSIDILLGRFFPPGAPGMAFAGIEYPSYIPSPAQFDLKDFGILNAVPRNRRTIERRLTRKFGVKGEFYKFLYEKKNLRSCHQCGNFYEPGLMCPYCYIMVMKETNEIRDKIQSELGLNPVEEDVVVLYDNEKMLPEFVKGKRVVEMNKPRPVWFSSNLMEPSTQKPNETEKEVKPSDLA